LARAQVIEVAPRELAVLRKVANGEVDVAVGSAIREALFLERRHELDHRRDVARGARLDFRFREAQARDIFLERGVEALGERIRLLSDHGAEATGSCRRPRTQVESVSYEIQ